MEAVFLCLLLLVIGGGSSPQLTAEQLASLIPASFPTRDLSRYTVRYLSSQASDSEACLQSQPPQTEASNATVQSCRTVRYSLSGGNRTGQDFYNISYLILVVSPGRYPYTSPDTTNHSIDLRQPSNIIITRHPLQARETSEEAVFMCATKNYTGFNGLYFFEAENIALLGVTFSNCGPFPTPVHIRKSNNVIIDGCTFKDNFNSGAYFFKSNSTFIKNSLFENNVASSFYKERRDLSVKFIAGGGLTLFFVNGSNTLTVIRDCIFRNNYAGINDTNLQDARQRPPLYVPRGHGGGMLISFQRTIKNKVLVRNCTFTNNSAELTGGGIAIEFYRGRADTLSSSSSQSASNNSVEVDNSLFENNFSQEGAAICVNTFEAANYNKLIVKESALNNNSALRTGGAISFNIQHILWKSSQCWRYFVKFPLPSFFARD